MDTSQPITETALVPLTGFTREQLTTLRVRFMSEAAGHYRTDPDSREIVIQPKGLEILLEKITAPVDAKKSPPAPPLPSPEKKDGPLTLTVTRRLASDRFVQAKNDAGQLFAVRVANHLDWRAGDTLQALPVPGQSHSCTHTGPRPKGRQQRPVWPVPKKTGGAA